MTRNAIFGIIVSAIIVFAIGLVYFFTRVSDIPPPSGDVSSTTPDSGQRVTPLSASRPQREMKEGWTEYFSLPKHFSILHPASLTVVEHPEDQHALTVTFENTTDVQGFQIFIVPYDKAQISEERFLKDIPSGVRNDVEEIEIDGVKAVAFKSTQPTLGETREIWFINKGYLYEVTAPLSLDPWIEEIMRTWKFF